MLRDDDSEERQELRQQIEGLIAASLDAKKEISERIEETEKHLKWQGSEESATAPPPPGTLNVYQVLQARKETYHAAQKVIRDSQQCLSMALLLRVPGVAEINSHFKGALHHRFDHVTPPEIVAEDLDMTSLALRRIIATIDLDKRQRPTKSRDRTVSKVDDLAGLRAKVREFHASGWKTPEEICEKLDKAGVTTPRQTKWTSLSWQKALRDGEYRSAVRTWISKALHRRG